MKTTFTLKQAIVEMCLKNLEQPLHIILFTMLLSIIPPSDGGYLLAGISRFDVLGDKSESNKSISDHWIIKLKEQNIPAVTGLTLIDARTDQDIKAIHEGDILSLAEVGSEVLNIRANVSGFVDHVDLKLKGPISYARTEWVFPYALFGDIEGNYGGKALQPGKYILKVTPYTKDAEGATFTLSFHVIKDIVAEPSAIEWDKTIGGGNNDYFSNAITTSDGGYLLAGYSYSDTSGDKSENNKGSRDYWIVKIDMGGKKVWDKTLGAKGSDKLTHALLTTDGGYLLAGTSNANASGDKSENSKGGYDYWVIKLKDQSTPKVSGLTLIDAATDQEIKPLNDGDVINLAEVGNKLLNIRASISPTSVDHVYFKLQGPVKHIRTERALPYALFGDTDSDYGGKQLIQGKYVLTVTPHNGMPHTISFEVIDTPEATAHQIRVYPVPTSDIINILHEGRSEEAQLMLLDFGGNVLLHQPLSQQPVEQLDLRGFRKGIYYLKVVSPDGVQVIRVAKE